MTEINKEEFIERLAKRAGFTKGDTRIFLDHLILIFEECVRSGDEINIRGFGKLQVSRIGARTTIDPHSGMLVDLPPTTKTTFRLAENIRFADRETLVLKGYQTYARVALLLW